MKPTVGCGQGHSAVPNSGEIFWKCLWVIWDGFISKGRKSFFCSFLIFLICYTKIQMTKMSLKSICVKSIGVNKISSTKFIFLHVHITRRKVYFNWGIIRHYQPQPHMVEVSQGGFSSSERWVKVYERSKWKFIFFKGREMLFFVLSSSVLVFQVGPTLLKGCQNPRITVSCLT